MLNKKQKANGVACVMELVTKSVAPDVCSKFRRRRNLLLDPVKPVE